MYISLLTKNYYTYIILHSTITAGVITARTHNTQVEVNLTLSVEKDRSSRLIFKASLLRGIQSICSSLAYAFR